MRYIMIMVCVLTMLFSQQLFASAKTDSIVSFLGGADAKFVWLKWAWCHDNYQPKSEAAAKSEGWSLELLDTREGKQRTLTTGCTDALNIRISRSGKWVTFVDGENTYIIDLTAAAPTKKVLMAKTDYTYWVVSAWWVDQTNGDEYAYCLDNCAFPLNSIGGGTGIYKVKLNSDGTMDHGTAEKLTINGLVAPGNGTPPIDISVAVSADGKKLGAAFPWPDTYILDIGTGNLDSRHHEGFGCQANLAPDNSYRFFHCEGDHQGVFMFDADMSTTNWLVNLRQNLAGYTGPTTGAEAGTDFWAPRWTNHVQYHVCTYPLNGYIAPQWNNHVSLDGEEFYSDEGGSLWSLDSNYVKNNLNMNRLAQCYLGKFSADFTTQEKSIAIARDPRYFQILADGWICNGTTYGDPCGGVNVSSAVLGNRTPGLSVVHSGAFVNIETTGAATVRITDAQGRLVRHMAGSGPITVDTRDLAVGAYVVSVFQHGNRLTKNVMISR